MNRRICAVLAAGVLWTAQAVASPIFYEVESLGDGAWRYAYAVGNDTGAPIESFRIYFEYGLYEFDLIGVEPFREVDTGTYAAPADWEAWVAPPDSILGEELDGFYDAFAWVDPIAPAGLLSGFNVSFSYLGGGTPGSQFFELLDFFGTDVLGSGFTQRTPVVAVSEPGTPALLAVGLLVAGWYRRRNCFGRHKQQK